MAFVPAAAGCFRARIPGQAGAGEGRTTSLPWGKVPHPGDNREGSQGPLGRVHGTGPSPCHPEEGTFLSDAHFHAGQPPPAKEECPGKN